MRWPSPRARRSRRDDLPLLRALPAAIRSAHALALVPLARAERTGTTGVQAPPDLLRRYVEAFFQLPTQLLARLTPAELGAHERRHPETGQRQLRTREMLASLRQHRPASTFALCAFTGEDLYPEESWNFVFGEASLDERVGVFSFARYEPSSPRFVRRCLDVLAHETGHMFGLVHCVYYACIMNGSNTLEESDRQPSHLCPVCLRKLQWATGFDVRARYADLEAVYREAGLENEARWTGERISALDAP